MPRFWGVGWDEKFSTSKPGSIFGEESNTCTLGQQTKLKWNFYMEASA